MVQRETGVPAEWLDWYRNDRKRATPEELERAARIERELNEMHPPASPEHRRVFAEAEKLVQESNERLRARGLWGKRNLRSKR